MTLNEMPAFQTLAEVAFWEEHDLADYWDELEEVSLDEAMPGKKTIGHGVKDH